MSDLREKLFYEKKNGYDRIGTEERLALEAYCRDYMAWLNVSRTEREAVANAITRAEEAGFVPYVPGMPLKAGDIVYVPKDDLSEYNVFVKKLLPTAQLFSLIAGRTAAVGMTN